MIKKLLFLLLLYALIIGGCGTSPNQTSETTSETTIDSTGDTAVKNEQKTSQQQLTNSLNKKLTESIDKVETMNSELTSTVKNYDLSDNQKSMRQSQEKNQWAYTAGLSLVLIGFSLIASATESWWPLWMKPIVLVAALSCAIGGAAFPLIFWMV